MDFSREGKHPVSFSVPDVVTVRQQMAYFSAGASKPALERLWLGARELITDWRCEIMPDIKTDLDSIHDPNITAVLSWAGVAVKNHIDSLENVPKN